MCKCATMREQCVIETGRLIAGGTQDLEKATLDRCSVCLESREARPLDSQSRFDVSKEYSTKTSSVERMYVSMNSSVSAVPILPIKNAIALTKVVFE